jgi:uncharacterized membrane protein YdfJ with MMPL/SSD domain/pSer/pThr/pTyr-binding forkhead associated (FHA) protein
MRLTIESGPGELKTIDSDGEIVIGRDEDCDLVLDDEQVSRHHASISALPDGRAVLVDLGSSNGTFIGGVRADGPVELEGDERIRIGDTVITVRSAGRTVIASQTMTLQIESGEARGRTVEATGQDFTIGRDAGGDLVLPDPTVSARHASLAVLAPGTGVLTDLGSRNGSFVNGRQIYEPVLLSGGERVRLGDTVLAVEARRAARAATAVAEVGAWLTVDSGADAGMVVKVQGDEFVIGRDEDAGLVLHDSSVSRRHALLCVLGPGRASITDLDSRNGTFVDGARLDGTTELHGQETVRIGDVALHFGEAGFKEPAAVEVEEPEAAEGKSPGRTLSPAGLARASVRRPWIAVAVWMVAFLVGGGLTAAGLKDSLTAERVLGGSPDSKRADTLLQDRLSGPRRLTELVVVRSAKRTVTDPSFRSDVEKLRRQIAALGPAVVVDTQDYYDQRNPALVSGDKHGVLIPVVLAGDFDAAVEHVGRVVPLVERTGRSADLETFSTGEASIAQDFRDTAERDLRKGESIGLAVALVVLLFVFGTFVAAFIPIFLAVFSIAIALGAVTLVAQVLGLSIFVTNMTVGMGLALGIDYTLFILTRFREERAEGRDVAAAIENAAATSGRSVLFSGLAVVLALVGMALVPDQTLRSLGIGAIIVGATSVLATLTLLPAWLSLLGDRIERGSVPLLRRGRGESGWEQRFWGSVAELVMRRPVPSLVLAVGLMLALAIPVFDLATGSNGVSTLPDSSPAKQGFEIVGRDFPNATSYPVEIVVSGRVKSPPVYAAISRLQKRLRQDRAFAAPQTQVNRAGDFALISAVTSGDPKGVEATGAVRRLRSSVIPAVFAGVNADVLVTGTTARDVDYVDINRRALPFVIAFVLGLSFILLMLVFRSIVVPAKALVFNLLSVGAAYGLLVLVFEKGFATGILGFRQVDRVEPWVPVFLFAVLFGLSMDYHVFLLSRIREHFNQTGDNRAAVAHGITSTAGIITGAALIMVAVFSGFALAELVPFQQLGFGMGVALLLDATIVRSVLVPAGMRLLGARNWYLPKWLSWLPEINVEGSATPPPTPAPAALASKPAVSS